MIEKEVGGFEAKLVFVLMMKAPSGVADTNLFVNKLDN